MEEAGHVLLRVGSAGGMKAALPPSRITWSPQLSLLWLRMCWAGRMVLGTFSILLGLVQAAAACEFGPSPYRSTGIVCRMTKPAALLCKCCSLGLPLPQLCQESGTDQPREGVPCFSASRVNTCLEHRLKHEQAKELENCSQPLSSATGFSAVPLGLWHDERA